MRWFGKSVTSRLRSITSWHMFVTVNVSFNAYACHEVHFVAKFIQSRTYVPKSSRHEVTFHHLFRDIWDKAYMSNHTKDFESLSWQLKLTFLFPIVVLGLMAVTQFIALIIMIRLRLFISKLTEHIRVCIWSNFINTCNNCKDLMFGYIKTCIPIDIKHDIIQMSSHNISNTSEQADAMKLLFG